MRATLAVVAATILVFLTGWVIDDVIRGSDIPRGVRVATASIGGMSRDEAAAELAKLELLDIPLELVWESNTVKGTAREFGVDVDTDATLAEADDRGGLFRPIRWLGSLLTDRSVEPVLEIDRSRLTDRLGRGTNAVLVIGADGPAVALVDGEFVAAAAARIPVVDIEELSSLLIDAVRNGDASVELPVKGTETLDVGGAALAAEANELTEGGATVSLVGGSATYDIPQLVVREWVRFGDDPADPVIQLDDEAVISTLETLFVGVGELGEQATFIVDFIGGVHIVGGVPGSVCCADDTAEVMLAGLRDGVEVIEVRPKEDPDAKGVAWAESLGITELVGQFTTYFKPGQSRVTNIARIAELTRGVVIEPGDTFSVNDFVGRRTVENGFVGAGMISNGVFITSVGGGISQYATTLFNAAFFAGLDFGEYQSHSIYIDRYPYGREATVSFPAPDLQIVNNTPYGVLVWPTTTADSITVQLYSTRWVVGEQTGQQETRVGVACTRVITERTRTWLDDGRTEVDTVTALYRPEATTCSGASTRPTTTTIPAPSTTAPT